MAKRALSLKPQSESKKSDFCFAVQQNVEIVYRSKEKWNAKNQQLVALNVTKHQEIDSTSNEVNNYQNKKKWLNPIILTTISTNVNYSSFFPDTSALGWWRLRRWRIAYKRKVNLHHVIICEANFLTKSYAALCLHSKVVGFYNN